MGAVKCMGKNPSRSWIFHPRFWSLSLKQRRLPATHTNNARGSNMSYQLSKRTGHIGTAINGRREMHGEVFFLMIQISPRSPLSPATTANISPVTTEQRKGKQHVLPTE